MRTEPNLLSPDQEAQFDSAMAYWQRVLNLDDWRVERGRRTPARSMAEVKVDYYARLAKYRTGDFGAGEIDAFKISQTALHENLHVLLFELLHLTAIGSDAGVLESAEHRVITTLEKLLLKAPE